MKRMWRITLLVIGLIVLPVTAQPLRLVANAWPPFTGKELLENGLAVDLVSTALQRAGYPSEYIEVPWARVLRGLEQGDYDVIISAWYSEDRERYGLFSAPYLVNRIRLLRHNRTPVDFNELADLRPFSIAVVRGYSYGAAFDQDQTLTKVPVLDFGQGARMLAAGRVQLALEDELVAQYYLRRDLGKAGSALVFVPKPLQENGLHILVRRTHPQYREIVSGFNRAIIEMRADGTYQRIYERHGLSLN